MWPEFTAMWADHGPYIKDLSRRWGPWHTVAQHPHPGIVGGTLTVAHTRSGPANRGALKLWLFITIALGVTFLVLQAYEYTHAYSELNLKLSTGVYGSTFFMLTGFHGFHVTVGAIMLSVMLVRAFRGHFDAEHHFAFEATAWYWHFVDVVWLLLFISCIGSDEMVQKRPPRGTTVFLPFRGSLTQSALTDPAELVADDQE